MLQVSSFTQEGGGSGLCHWTEWVGRISRNTTQEVITRVSTGHLQKLLAVVIVLPLMLFSDKTEAGKVPTMS